MTLKRLAFIALANLAVFTSCSDDVEESNITPPVVVRGDYENGILITNEGNFGSGNTSVTFVSNDLNTVETKVFDNVNNELLGDNTQSIAFNGDTAYIIVNGSNKVEVVNRYTFQVIGTIDTGLTNPRYMAFADGKGYITNWGDSLVTTDDFIAEINLTTNTVTSTISVTEGPEQIISRFDKLYISHKGGWGINNVVSIIDATNTSAVTYINVNYKPDDLIFDNDGNLIVLSVGGQSWNSTGETKASLTKINTVSNLIVSSVEFADGEHPSKLSIDGVNAYYYLAGSLYKFNTNTMTIPTTATITGLSFYDMSINNGLLYGLDAGDYSSNGYLRVYNLTTNTLVKDVEVGVIPGEVYFN